MKKTWILIALLLVTVILLTACNHSEQTMSVSGKNYLYEGEGCGGSFVISIHEDGTFSYYEGYFSSYIGNGVWELDGNTLKMTDEAMADFTRVNYFTLEGNTLIFRAEDSDNFLYVKVADGEKFSETEQKPMVS